MIDNDSDLSPKFAPPDLENGVGKNNHNHLSSSHFGEHLLQCLRDSQLELGESDANLIRNQCKEFETLNARLIEEKELVINQLKQNLIQITDKRLRASNNNANGGASELTAELTKNSLDFILKDKEREIESLKDEIALKDTEIKKLKTTIKEQDDVILAHNNNIFELKNNNETVLRAKQESFRVMTEDLNKRQKLIDDQNQVIKSLKEKIELAEEQYSQSRVELEKRLNDKENDLQVKIATFEANLYEGRQYFEEMLNEKDNALREKTKEINQLRQKLIKLDTTNSGEHEDLDAELTNESNDDSVQLSSSINLANQSVSTSNISNVQKFDSESMKNMKALHEHQIELLKVKIEMLEKTCANYQQGIKEMNKSFGYQQQSDEVASMQVFKDIMQQLQKTNVELETERIDLQVRVSKLKEELDSLRVEKENLYKKFQTADQHNQRLVSERHDVETGYQRQIDSRVAEIGRLSDELAGVKTELVTVKTDNEALRVLVAEYEQLKQTHQTLSQHYEQLYIQATEIVTANQQLTEQGQANEATINELKQNIADSQMKIDHLETCNSDLNTQKIELEMKISDIEIKREEYSENMSELAALRAAKLNVEQLSQQLRELEVEMMEKNELIDQMHQAKEFLADNNSLLLTNNIKLKLFIENMGYDQSQIEMNATVMEYENMRKKQKEDQLQLQELQRINQQLEVNCANMKVSLSNINDKRDKEASDLLSRVKELQEEIEALHQSQMAVINTIKNDVAIQVELSQIEASKRPKSPRRSESEKPLNGTEVSEESKHKKELSRLNAMYTEQIAQFEENFNNLQAENEQLQARLDELNEKLTKQAQLEETHKDLSAKYASMEQLNAKYKAKLKQLLKDGKKKANLETEAGSELHSASASILGAEEETSRSSNATPLTFAQPVTSASQPTEPAPVVTDSKVQTCLSLAQLDQLNEELADLNRRLTESNEENARLTETIRSLTESSAQTSTQIEQLSTDFNAQVEALRQENSELSRLLEEEKASRSAAQAVQPEIKASSNDGWDDWKIETQEQTSAQPAEEAGQLQQQQEIESLRGELAAVNEQVKSLQEKLEASQQQNLKFKAKLKKLMSKQKSNEQGATGDSSQATADANEETSGVMEPVAVKPAETASTEVQTEEMEAQPVEPSFELENIKTECQLLNEKIESLARENEELSAQLSDMRAQASAQQVQTESEREQSLVNQAAQDLLDHTMNELNELNNELYALFFASQASTSSLKGKLAKVQEEYDSLKADYEKAIEDHSGRQTNHELEVRDLRSLIEDLSTRLANVSEQANAKEEDKTEPTIQEAQVESVVDQPAEEKTSTAVQEAVNNWESNWDDVQLEENVSSENQAEAAPVEAAQLPASSKDAQLSELVDQQAEDLRRLHEMISDRETFAQSLELELKSQIESSHEVYEKVATLSQRVDELTAQNGQLKEEIEASKKRYDTLKHKAHAIKEKLKKYESAGEEPEKEAVQESVVKQVEQDHALVKKYESEVEELTNRLRDLEAELKSVKDEKASLCDMFNEQTRGFEENFVRLQGEVDAANDEMNVLKERETAANLQLTELGTKCANLEQQNLKYKAKLKQMLKESGGAKKKQADEQVAEASQLSVNVLVEESRDLVRSSNVTPTLLMPAGLTPSGSFTQSSAVSSQSDMDAAHQVEQNYQIQLRKLNEELSDLNRRLTESNEENARLTETIRSLTESSAQTSTQIEQLSADFNAQVEALRQENSELSRLLEEEKASRSAAQTVQPEIKASSNDGWDDWKIETQEQTAAQPAEEAGQQQQQQEIESLRGELAAVNEQVKSLQEKLEASQQQNLKYKAKLKQLMAANKSATSLSAAETRRSANSTPVPASMNVTDVSVQTESVEQSAADEATTAELRKRIMELEYFKESSHQELQYYQEEFNAIQEKYDELLSSSTKRQEEFDSRLAEEVERYTGLLESKEAAIEQLRQQVSQLQQELERVRLEQSAGNNRGDFDDQDGFKDEERLELLNVIDLKEKLIQQLSEELKLVKSSIEQQRHEYESNIRAFEETLIQKVSEKDEQLVKMSLELDELQRRPQKEESTPLQSSAASTDKLAELQELLNIKETVIAEMNKQLSEMAASIANERSEFERSLADLRETHQQELDSLKQSISLQSDNQSSELMYQLELKQREVGELTARLDELKQIIDSSDKDHRVQIESLKTEILAKTERTIELTNQLEELRFNLETKEAAASSSILNQSANMTSDSLDISLSIPPMPAPANGNTSLNTKCASLETQLKYCHEKCEKVVDKLNQLKRQNENLNKKIKTIKSMIYIA